MFKTRARKLEEEAKKQDDYIPTKDLEADEEKPTYQVPWGGIVVIGSLILLIALCIILIVVLRK